MGLASWKGNKQPALLCEICQEPVRVCEPVNSWMWSGQMVGHLVRVYDDSGLLHPYAQSLFWLPFQFTRPLCSSFSPETTDRER
jgi:hypothetical protein